jgi:hypothetical protein
MLSAERLTLPEQSFGLKETSLAINERIKIDNV